MFAGKYHSIISRRSGCCSIFSICLWHHWAMASVGEHYPFRASLETLLQMFGFSRFMATWISRFHLLINSRSPPVTMCNLSILCVSTNVAQLSHKSQCMTWQVAFKNGIYCCLRNNYGQIYIIPYDSVDRIKNFHITAVALPNCTYSGLHHCCHYDFKTIVYSIGPGVS